MPLSLALGVPMSPVPAENTTASPGRQPLAGTICILPFWKLHAVPVRLAVSRM